MKRSFQGLCLANKLKISKKILEVYILELKLYFQEPLELLTWYYSRLSSLKLYYLKKIT